jgi:hypothetical protein
MRFAASSSKSTASMSSHVRPGALLASFDSSSVIHGEHHHETEPPSTARSSQSSYTAWWLTLVQRGQPANSG